MTEAQETGAAATGRLAGKVALITGAGAGIGRGVALRFASEGASIMVSDLREAPGEETLALVRERGASGAFAKANIGLKDEIQGAVHQAVQAFGRIDILVNNAQGFTMWGRAEERTDEMWRKSIETGVYGTMWAMNAAFPYMRDQGGGRIINFGSLVGVQGDRYLIDYSAAKEAIRGLSRTAASEWGRHNILVNVICPVAATTAHQRMVAQDPTYASRAGSDSPLRRIGDPERDIGGAALFLASDDSCFVTGNTLFVDGGVHLRGLRTDLPDEA
ncbi:MAG: SDR family oxidoreductase [Caulobacteraceae bacterium]|nr:SDR family oxidoreductase [Caulobacteraceae bacterium]